jgi:hypothetical protein
LPRLMTLDGRAWTGGSWRPGGALMTNVGKWAAWYQGLEEPWPYGEASSYEIGAAWLADCALTEDWVAARVGYVR